MKNKYTFLFLTTFALSFVFQSEVFAQATRTWVSGVGDDANPCSRTAPCKTFAGAISKTAANGEISVLDPAGYGAVNITKSMTINGNGTLAGISNAGTNGIIVNGADIIVTIRNISINGSSTGLNGIRFLNGAHLNVENCWINGLASGYSGISVEHGNKGVLTVKNTNITGPTKDMNGIVVNSTSVNGDSVKVFLSNVNIQGVTNGIVAKERAHINVENCVISNTYKAVYSELATSFIWLSNTSVSNNIIGIDTGLGKVISFGNNQLSGNNKNSPMSVISSQ